jgi:NAD-dependent SIR2 family protein deacetylase
MSTPARPVIIFGAGATAACGGPITNQILPEGLSSFHSRRPPASYKREDFFHTVEQFLKDNFHLPASHRAREVFHYPGLPLLLSLLDTAIDRNQPFGGRILDDLRHIRASVEYLIFAVLQEKLQMVRDDNPYARLMLSMTERYGIEPRVISLNYDLIADSVMFSMALRSSAGGAAAPQARELQRLPNYTCDIRTPGYQSRHHDYGLLLKLHGSLNWLYCPNCHRLDIGLSEEGPSSLNTRKVLDDLYQEVNLHDKYSCQGANCPDCGSQVRPVLITPTHKKDYRNPHIAQVWYQAERALRESDRVFIIGYSLPDDDVEVIYLLKRGLAHLAASPKKITVVQSGKRGQRVNDHEVGRRYRALFGERFDWQVGGFQGWLTKFLKAEP